MRTDSLSNFLAALCQGHVLLGVVVGVFVFWLAVNFLNLGDADVIPDPIAEAAAVRRIRVPTADQPVSSAAEDHGTLVRYHPYYGKLFGSVMAAFKEGMDSPHVALETSSDVRLFEQWLTLMFQPDGETKSLSLRRDGPGSDELRSYVVSAGGVDLGVIDIADAEGIWMIVRIGPLKDKERKAPLMLGGDYAPELIISEVVARHNDGSDSAADLVVVKNCSSVRATLDRVRLKRARAAADEFAFPSGSTLGPGETRTVRCSPGDADRGGSDAYANFDVDAEGDTLRVEWIDREGVVRVIDTFEFASQSGFAPLKRACGAD